MAKIANTNKPKMQYRDLKSDNPLDAVKILQPCESSPFGAPGMPPPERVLDSPEGELSEYVVTLADSSTANADGSAYVRFMDIHLVANRVALNGAVYEFRDTKGEMVEPVPAASLHRIANRTTGTALFFASKPHELSPAQREAVKFNSAPRMTRFDPGLAETLGQLMIRQGELLLQATGHVKGPEYLAWEKEVLECGKLPPVEDEDQDETDD